VFLGAFAFFAWSMSWYDLASVMLDSRAFISWLGLSYVLAFAATELFRRRSFQSVCLALAAALVFLSDAERHSALLAQGPPGTINWAALSPAACAVTGSGLACNAMVLMHKEFYLLLCLFTVLAGLYRPLARRLKRNWLSPSRGS
jgi:hypothetical protein